MLAPAGAVLRHWLLVLPLASACADQPEPQTDEVDDVGSEGKADGADVLRVRVSDTTVWVDHFLARRGTSFVITGRASRNLEGVSAFINDDVYGQAAQPSPRTFEIAYGTSEIRPMLDGTDLFASLSFTHSNGRPDSLTAHTVVRPRVHATTGSTLAWTPEILPVVVAGRTVYRLKGRAASTHDTLTEIVPTAGTLTVDANARDFTLDLTETEVLAGTVMVSAKHAAGAIASRVTIALAVKTLGLTSEDVYAKWPNPTCTPAMTACLTALPDGALDLGSCGEARKVSACRGTVGAAIDSATIASTLAAVDTRLADPAFASDAVGLVGADHAAVFTAALRAKVAAAVDADGGLWLASLTARTAILGLAVDGTIDGAYARPLGLVAPHVATVGDLASTREAVADAVLAYLATQDYLNSEFGRTLDQLTKEFRVQHVQSIREFRETNTSTSFPTAPTIDIYLGQWLGAHTEVSVDRTTGAITNVLVELD